jgi:ribosomal protein S18 acetylase RimI-like enzyme
MTAPDRLNAARAAPDIRPLRDGDAPALLAFYNGLSRASIRTFRPLREQTTREVCEAIVRDHTAPLATRYDLAAFCDRTIIGWAFLVGLDKAEPSLGLGVADAYHGQGWGSALLDRLLAWARERALARVHLIAVQDNDRAVYLYQSRGFVTTGEFFDERDQLPYLRMVAELT